MTEYVLNADMNAVKQNINVCKHYTKSGINNEQWCELYDA